MKFCKQLIWSVPLSAAGILLGMTRNPQAIIGGLVLCIAVSIKWRMLMQEQQEDFLRSLKVQGNSLQGIFDCFLKHMNQSKADRTYDQKEVLQEKQD